MYDGRGMVPRESLDSTCTTNCLQTTNKPDLKISPRNGERHNGVCDYATSVNRHEATEKRNRSHNTEDHHGSYRQDTRQLEDARQLVDVRMIDFAHATHSMCVRDPIKYSGPDEGYILGLDTLISAFRTLGNV